MPVYSEESTQLTFTQGLWVSDSPDIHPGYCSELKNLLVSPAGSLVIRPSFILALAGSYQVGPSELNVSDVLPYNSLPYFPANYTRATVLTPLPNAEDVPILFEPHTAVPSASTVQANMINHRVHPGAANTQFAVSMNHFYNGFGYPSSNYVQYLDRIYNFWNAGGVYRVTGWQFLTNVGTNLTRTLIAASPAPVVSATSYNVLLDIYKDRMFMSVGKRVYYTDTAAVGGYPETWDIAANFFDLPVRTIYRTYILNNIMYFWTSSGVWSLQVLGDPASWIVTCVNPTISIEHPNAVAMNKGIFYYVNVSGIWATSLGEAPVRISFPIDEHLIKCGGVGVFAFEEGCLVCAQTYRQHASSATQSVLDESRIFYFNGTGIWTELKMPAFSSGYNNNNCIIIGTFLHVPADASNQRITTYFTAITGSDAEGWILGTYLLSRTHNGGDGSYSVTNDYAQILYNTTWSVIPSDWIGDGKSGKRVKFGYMDTFTREETDIGISLNLDGRGYEEDPAETVTLRAVANEDGNFLSQFSVDAYIRRLGIKLEGAIGPSNGVSEILGPRNKPSPIEIKSLQLIFSTGRKEDEGVTG